MKTVLVLVGFVAVLSGRSLALDADEVPNDKVKAAVIATFEKLGSPPEKIKQLTEKWDGSPPKDVTAFASLLRTAGVPEDDVATAEEQLRNVVRNKDNPAWKGYFTNLFTGVGGADPALVKVAVENLPDVIPVDVNEIKQALKKAGVPDQHAEGAGKIARWLGNQNPNNH